MATARKATAAKQNGKAKSKALVITKPKRPPRVDLAVATPIVYGPGAASPSSYRVEDVPITSIKPYSRNPRIIPPKAVEKVAASLSAYGLQKPLVVDENMQLLAGHTTLLAALSLGWTHISVHPSNLVGPLKGGYRIADNRTAQETRFDDDLLATEFVDLRLQGFDLDLTGFDAHEIESYLPDEGATEDADTADLTPPAIPTTMRGDVFALGRHRLMCGDATDAAAWDTLMQGAAADMLWTDPPYGVGFSTDHLREWDGGKKRDRNAIDITNDELSPHLIAELLNASLGVACERCRDGAAWYVAGPALAGPAWAFTTTLYGLGVFRQMLSWVKETFVLGRSDYHGRFEAVYYGWKLGAAHYFIDDRTQDTVWNIPRSRRSEEHPTMKPIELVARAIRNSSKPGWLVVDPFAGSGTTLIAAEQEGRVANLMEIDPRYCDVIIRRWETVTGDTAVKL